MRCFWARGLTLGIAILMVSALVAACGNGAAPDGDDDPAAGTATPDTVADGTPRPGPSPTPVGPPPEPADIDRSAIVMIDEWRAVQVPRYPNAELLQFNPEPLSQVENAGKMAFTTEDPASEVLAYYRAALPHLGWTEQSANARQIAATHEDASLVIGVDERDGQTSILMILTDALN